MVKAFTPPASQAVLEARARDVASKGLDTTRIEWFIEEVSDKINMTVEQRVRLATTYLRDKVVRNISRPVTKSRVTGKSGKSYTRVTDRSKAGEFPKADTTLLMKTIFDEQIHEEEGIYDGAVGTPLEYGLILELQMDRSFLVRSLNEERNTIVRILTGPIT